LFDKGHRGAVKVEQSAWRTALSARRNGPEFVSVALLKWVVEQNIESVLIDPGKPWQNGTTESFNGKLRDECPAMEWFRNRIEAKVVVEDWRQYRFACN
jgi:transposase InsO family protein